MLTKRYLNILTIGLLLICTVSTSLIAQRSSTRNKSGRKTTSDTTQVAPAEDGAARNQSGRKAKSGRKTTSGRTSRESTSRESSQSARIFDMGEGISSTDLIGAWEITSACVFEPGFEGDGLCATGDDIQEFVENINLLVKDDGTGFLDVGGEREELTWIEDENGFQVDIGDDDFGQFSLTTDGDLTIADDFGSGCYNDDDDEIEGMDNESDCLSDDGTWDEAASMLYIFGRIPEGEFDTESGGRIVSSSRRSWWSRAKRRARKAARRAADSAQRATETAQIARVAVLKAEADARKAALKLSEDLAAELEKQAINLAMSIAKDATNAYNAQIKLAEEFGNQLMNSPAYDTMANILASKGTPTLEQFSNVLDECDLMGKMMEDLNKKGMKSFFVGLSGSLSAFDGVETSIAFAVSIKDMLIVWDDLKHFREPSVEPNMAIQATVSRIYGTQYGTDWDVVFGWNTDEPQDTYGEFWDFSLGIEIFGGSLSSSSAISKPVIKWDKVSGGRYLGQGFSIGKGEPLGADFTFGRGICCISHINNNMKYRCK